MRRPALLWTAAWVAAVGLPSLGVVLYADSPGVATYQLNSVLVLPLIALVLYGLHRRLPLRLQWVAAGVLAPLGGIAYVVWPNDQLWNYGALTVIPLFALAVMREDRRRDERADARSPEYGGWADGPWGPP